MDKVNHTLNYNSKVSIVSLTGIIALACTAMTFALPGNAMADTTAIDEVNISVPVSCSFTAGGGSYSDSIAAGTTSTIVANNVTTSCNDTNGYAIYAIGYSDNTYDSNYHTDLIFSSDNTYNIKTNATGTNSNWKMKLTPVSDATISNSYDSFQNIPSAFTKVATFTGLTTASTITPSYQISISQSQPAGTYTGKVKYVLVHPNSFTAGNYSVVYNTNGGTGTNVTVSDIANYEPYTIAANTFTAPSGYQFAGWCTIQDNTQSPQTSCAGGTLYQPDDIATSLASAGGTFNLYATWSKLLTLADATNMQDLASNDYCTGTTIGDTATLTDSRDGTSYTVGKLADGKCWMLGNLALDLTSSTVLNGMDNTNTNASDTTLGYLKNGGGTTSDQYATTGVTNWTSSYSYSAPLVNMASKDVVPSDATSTAGRYKVGGYYNYCAASAGSYCYGDGTSEGTSSGNATEDICPAGWRMPTGSTSGEYSALANAIYGSTSSTSDATAYANYRSALHLPLSGYFYNGSPNSQGSSGSWWSSTRGNNYNMYYLYVSTSTINPANRSNRSDGRSLRCMAGS